MPLSHLPKEVMTHIMGFLSTWEYPYLGFLYPCHRFAFIAGPEDYTEHFWNPSLHLNYAEGESPITEERDEGEDDEPSPVLHLPPCRRGTIYLHCHLFRPADHRVETIPLRGIDDSLRMDDLRMMLAGIDTRAVSHGELRMAVGSSALLYAYKPRSFEMAAIFDRAPIREVLLFLRSIRCRPFHLIVKIWKRPRVPLDFRGASSIRSMYIEGVEAPVVLPSGEVSTQRGRIEIDPLPPQKYLFSIEVVDETTLN